MGFWSRLSRTFRRAPHVRDIDEEIAFHLAMKQREGANPRAARLRFGNIGTLREDVRAVGSFTWLESTVQDVRYAFRQFRRTPLLSATIVLSLTIGIAANTAIFTLVDAALLEPLPVVDPASLVVIGWTSDQWPSGLVNGHTGNSSSSSGRVRATSVAPGLHRSLASAPSPFVSLSGFSDADLVSLVIDRRPPEQVHLQYVSANLFMALGVPPVRGRAFLPDDDVVGAPPAVVISHRLWQRLFGGRNDAVGRSLRVNGGDAVVVGVAPAGFFGLEIGEWVDIYAPLAARVALTPRTSNQALGAEAVDVWWVRQIARLGPGSEAQAATAQLSERFRRLAVPESVDIEPGRVPSLTWSPGSRGFDPVEADQSRALWILLLLVGLVLLIVCANVANLLLARAAARQRESAVRRALGAGRGRLVRQQLIESLVLAYCGGALGITAGHVLARGLHLLFNLGPGAGTTFDLQLDWRILAFTAGVSMLTAVIFGLAPAIRVSRAPLISPLKAASRTIVSGHFRLPKFFVAGQLALSLIVLVAAGLLGRSLANLQATEMGFDDDSAVYVSVNPWRASLQPDQVGPYVEDLRRTLTRMPGVAGVATLAHRPLGGSLSSVPVNIPGLPFGEDGTGNVLLNELSDGALETLGLMVVLGRGFTAADMSPGRDGVLVDEQFVQQFLSGRQPIGQRFGIGEDSNKQYEIIGIVRRSRYHSLRSGPEPTMYRAHRPAQRVGRDIHFAIRADLDAVQLGTAIRQATAEVHPEVPITELVSQSALIDRMLRTERLLGTMSKAFSVVALTLAALGLGGLLAYAVARRTSEFGVRIALGATPRDIRLLMLREAAWILVT